METRIERGGGGGGGGGGGRGGGEMRMRKRRKGSKDGGEKKVEWIIHTHAMILVLTALGGAVNCEIIF